MTIGAGGVLNPVGFNMLSLTGLWSWAWSGQDDVNITTADASGTTVIDTVTNLASPGTNDFINNDAGDTRHGRPVYEAPPVSIDGGAYSAPYAPLTVAAGGSTQYMRQTTSMDATGEFYLIFPVYMERTNGDRYFAGNAANGAIIGSVNRRVTLVINTTQIALTADAAVADASVVEIWRDSSNDLHCWINGSDATSGTPSSTATFGFSGYGGADAGNSRADDYLLEQIACNALPSESERLNCRNTINSRWNIY